MDKKILFVVYQSPVGTIWVNEAYRTAFGMYGEDIEPSILFLKEATISISKNTQPEKIGLLPISMVQKFVKRYETEVFAVKEDVEKYNVKDIDENYGTKLINENQISDFLHEFDNVIFM